MNNNGARLVNLNWDKECEMDFITGRGFEITEPAVKGKDQKSMYGIQSPLFCSDWSDEDAFAERYTCECGEMRGKVFEGETCPNCHTEIKFKDVDLSITGWIILHNHKIIQPIFYNKLSSIIGNKQFADIVRFDKKVNKDGHLEEKQDDKNNPFKGIGIIEFRDRFDEIMDFYKNKKKNKREEIDDIMKEKHKLFASCIPVYSSVLRPISFKGESFFYSAIDKKYNSIFSSTRLLNDSELFEARRKKWTKEKRERMDTSKILSSIQEKLMELWSLIFEQIDQKDGHIKSEILGGMINFSSRCVIIPDATLKSDEVRLSYMCFLELFKYEIIACLVKMANITENDAYEQWFKARIKYSPKIYEVMNYILKKRKPKILINRNPTINYGSLLCVKVKSVKNEYSEDYTMSLPLQILPVLNADFDGDILNIVSLKIKKLEKAYNKVFNPKFNMYISRNDGLFNNDFNLYKDQLIGLYEFNNI